MHSETKQKLLIEVLSSTDHDILSSINRIEQTMFFEYPSNDSIKYDSGKLQTLAQLLFHLRLSKQRCVIYTHMFDMLDILERFVTFSKYSYLRIDQRKSNDENEILIEQFNRNKQIFLLILTTNVQVNLTGAETIIFYDYDWNRTRNEQIEGQCERLRRRKDVCIYRLISENTIEEDLFEQTAHKDLVKQYQQGEEQIEWENLENEIAEDDDRTVVEQVLSIRFLHQKKDQCLCFLIQLRPIERYALRCIHASHQEYPTSHIRARIDVKLEFFFRNENADVLFSVRCRTISQRLGVITFKSLERTRKRS